MIIGAHETFNPNFGLQEPSVFPMLTQRSLIIVVDMLGPPPLRNIIAVKRVFQTQMQTANNYQLVSPKFARVPQGCKGCRVQGWELVS